MWAKARQFLGRTRPPGEPWPNAIARTERLALPAASSLCIASGKGGTGKSLVTASVATLLAEQARTLILDADLGVGNAHILQDVSPQLSIADVVEERCSLRSILCHCRSGLDLLAGGSGYSHLAALSPQVMHRLALEIELLEADYRQIVIDSAAGISEQTLAFAAASDVVLVVTTPDVTAMTDAYALLKVLWQPHTLSTPLLVVNRATSAEEAQVAAKRIAAVAQKFLGREPRYLGYLPEDRAAFRCVQRRLPVVVGESESELAQALRELTKALLKELARVGAGGLGRNLARRVLTPPRSA